jgi:hypothetical protein
MAELLAEGHETGAVAKLLAVTPAAVSQSRSWLEASWIGFQGEALLVEVVPGRRPVGRPCKAGHGASCRSGQQAALHVGQ